MKIVSMNLAVAAAVASAIVWIACSLLVLTMPGAMMTTTGHMMHMDMKGFGWMLSPFGLVWGLIVWSLFAGVFAWLLATIYNLMARR